MILNFAERRVHFQRRLRGVVYGTARAAVNLAKKLHIKLRRTLGEPQLSLFFKELKNPPTRGCVARSASAAAGPRAPKRVLPLAHAVSMDRVGAHAPQKVSAP